MPGLRDNLAFADIRGRDVLAFGQRIFGRRFDAICHAHERQLRLIERLRELSAIRRSNRAWQNQRC